MGRESFQTLEVRVIKVEDKELHGILNCIEDGRLLFTGEEHLMKEFDHDGWFLGIVEIRR